VMADIDYLLIGDTFSSLLVASKLEKQGKRYLIVAQPDLIGREYRASETPFGTFDHGISAQSENTFDAELLGWLEDEMGLKIHEHAVDAAPQTFQKGEFTNFIGFGQQSPEFYQALADYICDKYSLLIPHVHQWITHLLRDIPKERFVFQQVVKMNFEGDRLDSVTLSDRKAIKAAKVIYFDVFSKLMTHLPNGVLTGRALQKISRAETWTSVYLDLIHRGNFTENRFIHVLYGTGKEAWPCVGVFESDTHLSHVPEGFDTNTRIQRSSWVTFVRGELTFDDEATGGALREVKRQIKRAYPDIFNEVLFEKVSVHPLSHNHLVGVEKGIEADGRFTKLANLYVASPELSEKALIWRQIDMARRIQPAISGETNLEASSEIR